MSRFSRVLSALFCAAACCLPASASAQLDPPRPIRMIVPFSPGGFTDIITRVVAQHLSVAWKQQVIVENKPGANGIIGSEIVARAAPDGHTLLVMAPGHASNVSLQSKLPYDTLRDFTPIALLITLPSVLVVHPSVPVATMREFIDLAKSKPGELAYGSGGNGSSQHLAMEMLKTMAGIDLVHVPYKGSAPAEADLVGGQVKAMFAATVSITPQIKAGRLKALAMSSAKRSQAMPDVPTVAESGLPGYVAIAWAGMLGPKDLPRPIVDKLNAEVTRIMALPEVQARITALGAEFQPNTPQQFDAFIREEIIRWAEVIKKSNIKVD